MALDVKQFIALKLPKSKVEKLRGDIINIEGVRITRMSSGYKRYRIVWLYAVIISLIFITESFLADPEVSRGTAKSVDSAASPNKPDAAKSPKVQRVRKSRHSRLRVTRVRAARKLKPMPALSETPFPAEVALLPVIENAKSQLEKEKVSYFAASKQRPARREIKLALANFKTGEIQIAAGIEEKGHFSLNDEKIRYQVC